MKNLLVGLLVFTLVIGAFSVVGLAQGGSNGNGGKGNGPGQGGNNVQAKGNGNRHDNGIQERDREQVHIDDPLYQNNEILNDSELDEEEMEKINQLKEDFFDDRDSIVDELRKKRQDLNYSSGEEATELENEIEELENKLDKLREEHIDEAEKLVV